MCWFLFCNCCFFFKFFVLFVEKAILWGKWETNAFALSLIEQVIFKGSGIMFQYFSFIAKVFFIISWNLCWKKHCVTFQTQGTITPHTIVILPNTNGMHLLLCYDSKWLVCLFTVTVTCCCPLLWWLQVFLFAMTATGSFLCYDGDWFFSLLFWQKLVVFLFVTETGLFLL